MAHNETAAVFTVGLGESYLGAIQVLRNTRGVGVCVIQRYVALCSVTGAGGGGGGGGGGGVGISHRHLKYLICLWY